MAVWIGGFQLAVWIGEIRSCSRKNCRNDECWLLHKKTTACALEPYPRKTEAARAIRFKETEGSQRARILLLITWSFPRMPLLQLIEQLRFYLCSVIQRNISDGCDTAELAVPYLSARVAILRSSCNFLAHFARRPPHNISGQIL